MIGASSGMLDGSITNKLMEAKNVDAEIKTAMKKGTGRLKLKEKQLTEVPAAVCDIKGLKILDMSKNSLQVLPKDMKKLGQLERLVLEQNKLRDIGIISQLPNLNRVQVSNNRIEGVPEKLDLKKLEWFYAENNKLLSIPSTFGDINSLKGVRLTANKLKVFPDVLLNLSNLLELALGRNGLSSIPKEIGNLKKLIRLELAGNKIKTLPKSLGELKELQVLDVGGNRLTTLPSFVGKLAALTELTLCENKALALLPPELAQCKQLAFLDASGCALESLPEQLVGLEALREMYLSKNNLAAVPPVASLQLLDISYNNVSDLDNIGNMLELRRLNISNNKFAKLPKELGNLEKLAELAASRNQINGVTAEVEALEELKVLDLSHNKLDFLPQQLGSLPNLDTLILAHNELSTIPKEIKKQGTAAVKKYLAQLNEKSTQWRRMKLMFVGQEAVGKTTLLNCFRRSRKKKKGLESAELDTQQTGDTVATDGIDIHEWESEGVIFSSWDFAGQEVYYPTHQFFLSSRSMYLVIYNLLDTSSSKVEYWLRSVTAKAGRPPVFLVGTHAEDERCTPEYVAEVTDSMRKKFGREFTNIVDYVTTSAITREGIEELKAKLVNTAKQQKSMKNLVPGSYIVLEQHIKKIKQGRQTVTWKEWKEICGNCGVPIEDTRSATAFFHDVGNLIHVNEKSNDLRNLVILNPQWIANVFSSVITLKHQYAKGGILLHDNLSQIWRDFDKDMWPKLLALLERFEVAFDLPPDKDGKKACLIPSLLEPTRPEIIGKLWPPFIDGLQLGRSYQFKFLPLGMFSKLFVRIMHVPVITAMHYWATGCFVTHEAEEALVTYKPSTYQLELQVRRCEHGGKLLRLLIETVETLIQGWYHSDVITSVPCAHCVGQRNYDPVMFPIEEITEAVMEGEAFMYCNGVSPIRVDYLAPDLAFTDFSGQRIKFKSLELVEEIGTGAFGKVYKAKWKDMEVAVKKLDKETRKGFVGSITTGENTGRSSDSITRESSERFLNSESDIDEERRQRMEIFNEFQRECWIMGCMNHPNIVQLIGMCLRPLCMVMELCELSSLYRLLEREKKAFKKRVQCRIAHDTAKGMLYLHTVTPPVIHRDLRSPNVLVRSLNWKDPILCKVGDFGLARLLASAATEGDADHNPHWLAPEVMNDKPYTKAADVYSFGIILWEILTQKQPFQEFDEEFRNPFEFRKGVISGLRPTIPTGSPPAYVDLIERCWHGNPSKRPTFEEIEKELRNICLDAGISASVLNAEGRDAKSKSLSFNATKKLTTDEESKAATTSKRKVKGLNAKQVAEVKNLPSSCLDMVFVKNHVWCALGNGQIAVYDTRGQIVKTLVALKSGGRIYACVASGSIVWTAGEEGRVTLWNAKNFKRIRTMVKHDQLIKAMITVRYRKRTRIWTGDGNGDILIWKGKGRPRNRLQVEEPITSMCQYQNIVWVGLASGFIAIVDIDTLEYCKWKAHEQAITSMMLVGANMWTASNDNLIRVWTAQSGKRIAELKGHTGRVHVLALVPIKSKKKKTLYVWSGAWDKTILVWDPKKHKFVQQMTDCHTDAIRSFCLVNVPKKASGRKKSKQMNQEIWSGAQELDGTIKRWAYS